MITYGIEDIPENEILDKLRYNYKIKKIVITLFAIFTIITIAIVSVVNYKTFESSLYKHIDNTLKRAADAVLVELDESFFDKATEKGGVAKKEDEKNRILLSKIAKAAGVKYIYTMYNKDGDLFFTSSSATDAELKREENLSYYFDKYEEASQKLKNIFVKNQVVYEETTDRWGSFRTILIPMQTKKGTKYVVGADIDISFIDKQLNRELYFNILIFFMELFFLLFFVIFMKYFLQKELDDIKLLELTLQDNYKKLKEAIENFQNIFNSTMEMIILSDEYGNILNINRAGMELMGIKNKYEAIGKNLSQFVPKDSKEDLKKALQKKKTDNYELKIVTPKKKMLYVLANGKNIVINKKNIRMSSVLDITEIKEKERAIQDSKAKSAFLANMSHEIRTPLNAIVGFISLLKEEVRQDKKLTEYIDIIETSSVTLLQVIEDILDFSKIESGKLEIDKQDFNAKKEFESLVHLFDAKASEKNISLQLEIDESLPQYLHSDSFRIKQIISNLLSNAIKFTPEGKKIVVTIQYLAGRLYVSVKDEGIGIAPNKLEHIFQPFNQEDSSVTRKYGGSGLGLSICNILVKLLGGKLKVESTLGEGSEFYFDIPVEVAHVQHYNEEENDQKEVEFEHKKILLVEDNKANQMYMKVLLKKLNIDFDIAFDGVQAVALYKDNYEEYDAILMDENMPNMNGLEATKKILEYENTHKIQHTPIIALTANAIKGDRRKFLEAGMDEYIAKPVAWKELAEILLKIFTIRENR